MRALIPCYGSSAAIVITDKDVVMGSGRVAHQYPDGSWVRIEPDGSVGSTPATAPAAAYEIAAVSDELRIYCPTGTVATGTVAYPYRVTNPGSVPNV
jgi:hypothetical protein